MSTTTFIHIGSPTIEVVLDDHAMNPVVVEMKGIGKVPWEDAKDGCFMGRRMTWGQREFIETVRPRVEAWMALKGGAK